MIYCNSSFDVYTIKITLIKKNLVKGELMRKLMLVASLLCFIPNNSHSLGNELVSDIKLSPEQEQLFYRCNFDELFHAGRLFKINGRNKNALQFFEVALLKKPYDWKANWELGDLYGLFGDLTKFWLGQKYRWQHNKNLTEHLWQGEPLKNKRILLYGLWGLGDTLQY